jgi:hypothetical protein
MERLPALLERQAGVVARRQVLELGLDDEWLRRAVHRRELRRVHQGVYVNHTGPLTWLQRAWAAVLFYWPAALSHESVLRLFDVRRPGARNVAVVPDQEPVCVVVDHRRTVTDLPGVRCARKRNLLSFMHPSRRPPQVRLEHAVLDVAAEARTDEIAIATLANACQSRRTTAARLLSALDERPRLKRRRFLREVLADVASGAHSVLEHRYLTRVERPHGLPTAKRQRAVKTGRSRAYRDVEYARWSLVVELDGRLGHEEQWDRWDDLDRDIDTTVSGKTTLRLGWRHVLQPCRTAIAVGRMLNALGWRGSLRPCSPQCPVNGHRVGLQGNAA